MRHSFSDNRGVAVPFLALSLVLLIVIVGLVVDGGRLLLGNLRLQGAVDATAIGALPYLGEGEEARVDRIVRTTFRSNLLGEPLFVDTNLVWVSVRSDSLEVEAQASVPLHFMPILPAVSRLGLVNAAAVIGRQTLRVALVLDMSGSMLATTPCSSGWCSKFEELQAATKAFIELLDPSRDEIAVLLYNNPTSLPTVVKAFNEPLDKPALIQEIDSLPAPSGKTCISCGIRSALLQFQAARSNTPADQVPQKEFMIVMTDGHPTAGLSPQNSIPTKIDCGYTYRAPDTPIYCNTPENCPPYRYAYLRSLGEGNRAKLTGVTIYTIGIGNPINDTHPACKNPWGYFYDHQANPPGGVCGDYNHLNQFFLAELANDPVALGLAAHQSFPHKSKSIEELENECLGYDTSELEWNQLFGPGRIDCGCLPRTGSAFPEGKFLYSPNAEHLTNHFTAVFEDAAGKPRVIR